MKSFIGGAALAAVVATAITAAMAVQPARAQEPRAENPAAVRDQDISRWNQLLEIGEYAVRE